MALVGAEPGGIRQLVVINRRHPAVSRMNECRAANAARPAALYGWARPLRTESPINNASTFSGAALAVFGANISEAAPIEASNTTPVTRLSSVKRPAFACIGRTLSGDSEIVSELVFSL